jgi:hypothetical protein
MKRTVVPLRIAWLVLGTISVASCSDWSHPSRHVAENAGEVGVALQVGGTIVTSVSYVLTNGIHTYQGTISVGEASTLLAVLGGIEAGSMYVLTLSATGTGGVPCSGTSAPFTIVARATVIVGIQLVCAPRNDAGSVKIEGTVASCASFASVSAAIPSGNEVRLSALTSPATPSPPVSISWTVTLGNGTLSSNVDWSPAYTCAPEDDEVRIDVTLAQAGLSVCTNTFHLIINCPPGPDPG